MYEFQHTQLSLLREAISRRGQCTDALVSNTSSVAYTCRMQPIWSALVLRVLQWTKIHHACGHSESLNMASRGCKRAGLACMALLQISQLQLETQRIVHWGRRWQTLMRRDTPAVAKNSSSRSKEMEHSMSAACMRSPFCTVAFTCNMGS